MRVVLRSSLAAASLLVSAGLLAPSPASAHPFGDPQTVGISVDPDDATKLNVSWSPGAIDDLALLRDFLGLPGETYADDELPDLAASAAAARQLASAPELTRYLLSHVSVSVAGSACDGHVEPIDSLAGQGASLSFACPAAVSTASVRVTMLTDLHPAYRTLATGPGGQRAVYDSSHEEHDWSATASSGAVASAAATSTARSAALQLSVTGGATLGLAGLIGLVVTALRRRTRKERPA